MKFKILFLLSVLALASCEPESQTDYVQLTIPEELKSNSEVVASLEKDAKQLNRALNSIEDYLNRLLEIGEEIEAIEEDTDPEQLKKDIEKSVEKLATAQAKFMLNLAWFGFREVWEQSDKAELLQKMSNGETIVYEKSVAHLKIKQDLVEEKLETFSNNIEQLTKRLEEKEAVLKKYGEEHKTALQKN